MSISSAVPVAVAIKRRIAFVARVSRGTPINNKYQ
jgi:hypothetical protein